MRAGRQAIAAHAEYMRSGPTTAEVAFATSGDRRGVGLATLMLARLAERTHALHFEPSPLALW